MLIVPEFKEQSPGWSSEESEIKHLHTMPAAENSNEKAEQQRINTPLLR